MFRILVLTFTILVCSLFVNGSGSVNADEGQKILNSSSGTYKIVVPEKAPDFLYSDWKENILAQGRFPNGTIWVIRLDEKQEMVVSSLVIGVEKDGELIPLMVVFCVAYKDGEFTDFYYDKRFIETGKPSGVFIGPIGMQDGKALIEIFVRHFNHKI